MGGCCSSSRKSHLHGRQVYYYYPAAVENGSLTSNDPASTAINGGILYSVDQGESIPSTYQAPPKPLPYDTILGLQQSTVAGSKKNGTTAASCETTIIFEDLDGPNCKDQEKSYPSEMKSNVSKSNEPSITATEEEDACPICLEEYDVENPKIDTECEHYFHLSCILEWMERSEACPICDQDIELGYDFN